MPRRAVLRAGTVLCVGLCAMATHGCATGDASGSRPALRSDFDAEATQELARVSAALLGSRSVTLADDAFRESPEVTVEARPARSTVDGPRTLDGRRRDAPQRLRLEASDAGCVLVALALDARQVLDLVRCRPFGEPARR